MVERVVYVGSIMQVIVHLAPGQTLQAWVQNLGEELPYRQGEAVSVHLPADALRVLVDTSGGAGCGDAGGRGRVASAGWTATAQRSTNDAFSPRLPATRL